MGISIIGIDQSLSNTGLTILKRGEKPLYFSIQTGTMRGVKRLSYITGEIIRIISDYCKNNRDEDIVICREDYAYGAKGDVFNLGEVGGCIDLTIYNHANKNSNQKMKHYKIPPNSWKLLVLGSGQVKKDTQYLLTVFNKTGEKFDNDNIADSYMIAIAIGRMIDNNTNDMSTKSRFGMISSSIRKKNKITERNIGTIDKEKFDKLVFDTLREYLIFET